MVTGDHPITANAIAKSINIITPASDPESQKKKSIVV